MKPPFEPEICIAGGGPAGMVLGYLLARCGIRTLVLESQLDFDRDFRGDTLHAGVMEVFDSMGVAERILELPHSKIAVMKLGDLEIVNFSWLKTKFPYVTMMAQSTFLGWLAEEAKQFSSFRIEMGAKARELLKDETGRVTGLCYRQNKEHFEIQARLVVACDGRASTLRKTAGLVPKPVTDPLEVLWFRLPKLDEDDGKFTSGALTGGRLPLILLERPDEYQIAAAIPTGGYAEIRKQGLSAFHERIREAAPGLHDRAVRCLDEWKKIAFLHVEGSRLSTWHLPGLLFIGDAAHVMTPVGGVGINYAIWDAVEAANVIVPAMKSSEGPTDSHLAEVQRRREGPTKMMQKIQRLAGRRVLAPISEDESKRLKIPMAARVFVKIPVLRTLLPRLIALGWRRTHCEVGSHFVP